MEKLSSKCLVPARQVRAGLKHAEEEPVLRGDLKI